MKGKYKGTDPREFIRAANDTQKDVELMFDCVWNVNIVPSFSRSVLGIRLECWAVEAEPGSVPAVAYEVSWPAAQVSTLEAFLYSTYVRFQVMVEEAFGARGRTGTPQL